MKKFLELSKCETLSDDEVKMISPLKLAYIGDAIYEVFVRTYVLNRYKTSVNSLNRESVRLVKASAQAHGIRTLNELGLLTEKEWSVVKKGRNQKTATSAKNASLADYKYATGFEALIGYLSLDEQQERLEELIGKTILIINGDYNE